MPLWCTRCAQGVTIRKALILSPNLALRPLNDLFYIDIFDLPRRGLYRHTKRSIATYRTINETSGLINHFTFATCSGTVYLAIFGFTPR